MYGSGHFGPICPEVERRDCNIPNRPEDVKTTPVNEAQAEEHTAPAATPPEIADGTPAPEMTAEEAATLADESEATQRKRNPPKTSSIL
ncbi:hypothetical protein SAMN04488542_107114 [Fontibacillus panacisegetis]|uniref:Uncharacterized protein n=1 Tax=Fontibacillus panacisegetis TaxID=670482 RepID=A0A1G7JD83_9BACL|nr:hypothetical protein [Fontibacillus panacisegetis]SDF22843.1 hypothetical protein SAMN04488542_107114 [Fontibacillus panacisegetis]